MSNTPTTSNRLIQEDINTLFGIIDPEGFANEDKTALINIILNGENPDSYFNPLGYGAYKECYEFPHINDYILKFANCNNQTETEKAILQRAHAANVDKFFLTTFFLPLYDYTVPMPLLEAEADDYGAFEVPNTDSDYYGCNDTFEADYLIIQPRIYATVADLHHTYYDYKNIYELDPKQAIYFPDVHGSQQCFPLGFLKDMKIRSKQWIEDAVSYYGFAAVRDFAVFCGKYNIHDLHNSNIGYVVTDGKMRPVIFDWLSDEV